jgi:transcriptional repressor NrdR
MECPFCGYRDSRVVDSRGVNDGIRRRRQCLSCGARFTTYERVQPAGLFVVKKDGRIEEFNREKLVNGIRKACEKRPLAIGSVEKLAGDIESEIDRLGRAEVPSTVIGDMVMDGLKKLDHVAYIRFGSIYREFTDIDTLKRAVDSLVDNDGAVKVPNGQLPLLPDESVAVGKRRTRRRRS